MESPSFAPAQHHLSGNQTFGAASHGDDKGLFVEFVTKAVHQPFLSEKEGRPIYKDVHYVTIDFPGDKTKRVDRPVKLESDNSGPSDPERFPRQWHLFQNQLDQTDDGMPITEWPPLTKSQALELKAMKIHTVEKLAELPDSACTWMGSRELRAKAQTWLETANGHSAEARLQLVIDQQAATMRAMQHQLDDLALRYAQKGMAMPDGRADDPASTVTSDTTPAPRKKASSRAAATQEN